MAKKKFEIDPAVLKIVQQEMKRNARKNRLHTHYTEETELYILNFFESWWEGHFGTKVPAPDWDAVDEHYAPTRIEEVMIYTMTKIKKARKGKQLAESIFMRRMWELHLDSWHTWVEDSKKTLLRSAAA